MKEIISVVIPCHNCSTTIAETINSVIAQVCNCEIEIIVINDGSKDSTSEILDGLSNSHSNILVKTLDNASGRPSVPRNIGLDLAKGDFVCFMDADDVMPTGYLDAARKTIQASNEFCGSLKHPFKKIVPAKNFHPSHVVSIGIPKVIQYSKNVFTTSGLLFPKKLIDPVRFENTFLEDWRFLVRLYEDGAKGKLLLSPRVFYRIHSASLTPKKKRVQVKRIFTVLMEKHGLFVSVVLFVGYFLVGALKIFMESGAALRLTQHTS